MNILIFSPTPSHPQSAGNRSRIFHFGKALQGLGHSIHFVFFRQEWVNKQSLEAMRRCWDSLTIIEKTINIPLSTEGYALDAWYQDDIAPKVNAVIREHHIDAIMVNYLMQSKLLESVPSHILKLIDTHDIFADRHLKVMAHTGKAYNWFSVSKEDEIRGLNRADIVIAIQESEAAYFSSVIDKKVKVVGHMEMQHFVPRRYDVLQKAGFVGSNNDHNRESIKQFLKLFTAHPIAKKIQIVIVGSVCDSIEIEHPNVILKGFVENLDDFYAQMDLIVNPLIFSTGLNIKTVEALSFGLPIVSTSVGFRGLESSEACHQYDDLAAILEYLAVLQKKEGKLRKLADTSRTVFGHYTEKVQNDLKMLFEDANIQKQKDKEHFFSVLYKKLTGTRS